MSSLKKCCVIMIIYFFFYIISDFSKCQDSLLPLGLDTLIEFVDENGSVHYIDVNAEVDEIPDIDVSFTRLFDLKDVSFWLYTRNNIDDYKELFMLGENEVTQDLDDVFNANRELVAVTHGWKSSGSGKACQLIKEAFLAKYDVNVLVVDWPANSDYATAAISTIQVAEKVRQMIKSLVIQYAIEGKDIHLIGHSLGAHIMGLAGRFLRKKDNFTVGRVTGLDPARPLFELPKLIPGITSEAAAFVDIIHTNRGLLGYFGPAGHADFYPNGGFWQPHCCKDDKLLSCAHACAYIYFAETILGIKYKSVKCHSYIDFLLSLCYHNEMQLMGLPAAPTANGTYYLRIASKASDSIIWSTLQQA